MNTLNSLKHLFPILPLEKRIEIQIGRFLRLSSTVLSTRTDLPLPIAQHIEKLEPHTFRPHQTRFQTPTLSQVQVIQEIPLHWGFQPSLRQQIISFWHLVKRTRRILLDLIEHTPDHYNSP